MDDDATTLERVQMALAQAKRVSRESRIAVQQLARLRDHLQPEEAQGNDEYSSNEED